MEEQKGKIEVHVHSGGQVNLAFDDAHIDAKQNNESQPMRRLSEGQNDTDYVVSRSCHIQKYFVKTALYKKALRSMKDSNIILLIGDSGSGKTDNSIMLAAEYSNDYILNFAEGSDSGKAEIENVLQEIKNKNNYGKKEIIIFDDFLGKTHLNTQEEYLNLVGELIKCTIQNPNKKLILNSRITILEDAKIQSDNLNTYIENDIEIININRLEDINERCEILAMYVGRYDMQNRILQKKNMLEEILEHPNFSPLIIQRVLYSCSKNESKDLEKTFLDMLNNPNNVWESEIKALNKYSGIYLNILYSLSDTWVKQAYVDKAFLHYMGETGIEYTDNIQKTVQRLTNLLNFESQRITFWHPSIIDYLRKEMTIQEKEEIMRHALYFEQIERLDDTKEQIKYLYSDIDKFFSLKVLPHAYANFPIEFENYIGVKFLDYMLRLKIDIEEELLIAILKEVFKCSRLLLLHYSNTILQVLLLDYNFSEIVNNDSNMQELLEALDYEEIGKFLELTCTKVEDTFDFEALKPYIQQAIQRKLDDAASDKVNEAVQDVLSEYVETYFEQLDEGEEFYYEDVAQEVEECILDDINISNIISEAKEDLCQKYKLCNYEGKIEETYDIEIDHAYIEDFIREYNK